MVPPSESFPPVAAAASERAVGSAPSELKRPVDGAGAEVARQAVVRAVGSASSGLQRPVDRAGAEAARQAAVRG